VRGPSRNSIIYRMSNFWSAKTMLAGAGPFSGSVVDGYLTWKNGVVNNKLEEWDE